MGADHSTAAFTALADLASARVGGRAIATNDDFFAPKSNLVKPEPPIFIPGKFTSRGKWMDGWESRRRRTPGHDWCVVALGMRGVVRGVNVDTQLLHRQFSVALLDRRARRRRAPREDGSLAPKARRGRRCCRSPRCGATATTSSPSTTTGRGRTCGSTSFRTAASRGCASTARSRSTGRASPGAARVVDLASIRNGGLVLGASDMHFGARDNMIMPGRAKNMGDGWETRRRRGPGYDWAIVRLGAPGVVTQIEIDTNHFKGNYPDSASIEGCLAPGAALDSAGRRDWREILPRTKLRPHHRHFFAKELATDRAGVARAAQHLSRTAASAACASMERVAAA